MVSKAATAEGRAGETVKRKARGSVRVKVVAMRVVWVMWKLVLRYQCIERIELETLLAYYYYYHGHLWCLMAQRSAIM